MHREEHRAHEHEPGQCALVQAVASDVETIYKGVAESTQAVQIAQSVEWKLNWILGVLGTGLCMGVAAFVWLFTQQQQAFASAVNAAGREARTVVAEQDRHFDARATDIAREAVRLDRAERAREGMTVVAVAK